MIITNKKNKNPPQIFMRNNPAKYVDSFKYVGMNIDSELKFSNQKTQVKGKISRMCGVSFRLNRYVNRNAAINMYYSGVCSSVPNCISLWCFIVYPHEVSHLPPKLEEKKHVNCLPREVMLS